MQSKPDVRPNVSGHPDPERRRPLETPARRLFEDRGGARLRDDLNCIEGTLEMHEQDIERGRRNEEPEKFRWRVNPANAIRLRAERRKIEAAIDVLMRKCETEAAGVETVAAEESSPPRNERPANWIHDTPTPDRAVTETEVALPAPIHTAA